MHVFEKFLRMARSHASLVKKYTKRYKTKRVAKRRRKTVRKAFKYAKKGRWSKLGGLAMKYALPVASGIAKLSGYGDYHSAGGINLGDQVPIVKNTNVGTIIRHREYIGDLQASAGFVSTAHKINPANGELFPWLAGIARNYEQWVPRGIVMEYKTMSSDVVVNVTSGSPGLGTVIMATDYNVYNPPFASKQQMEVC